MSDFDPAAEFLLSMPYENLFERANAADPDAPIWRCKGCRDLVKRSERERHYKAHRTIQERAERKAAQYLQQQRLRNLERARAAKGCRVTHKAKLPPYRRVVSCLNCGGRGYVTKFGLDTARPVVCKACGGSGRQEVRDA